MPVSPWVVVCVISMPRPYSSRAPECHRALRRPDDSGVASPRATHDDHSVPEKDDLRARLEALAGFTKELEAPDFDAGHWHDSEVRQTPDGEIRTMPWFELSGRGGVHTNRGRQRLGTAVRLDGVGRDGRGEGPPGRPAGARQRDARPAPTPPDSGDPS